MKSGNLNFLEPSGPLQACNGTALPLSLYLYTAGVDGLEIKPSGRQQESMTIHKAAHTVL